MRIYIVDNYVGDGLSPETAYRPAILDAGILSPGDTMSIQPSDHQAHQLIPNPNILVLWIDCQPATLAAIEGHANYGEGSILYDDPNPYRHDEKPNANEYGKRRSHFAKLGVGNAQFRAMFGDPGNPHARKVGADNCIAWTKGLKKL